MTEDGEIDRPKVDVFKDKDFNPETLATVAHFVSMGIASERIGTIGSTVLYRGHFTEDSDLKSLPVVYAWQRRPNETGPTLEPAEQPAAAAANDNPTVNRAIAEHDPELN